MGSGNSTVMKYIIDEMTTIVSKNIQVCNTTSVQNFLSYITAGGNINFNGITINTNQTMIVNCSASSLDSDSIANDIKTVLEQIDKEMKEVGIDIFNQGSNNEQYIKETIKNAIKSEQVQKCVSSLKADFLSYLNAAGNVNIENVDIYSNTSVVANCVSQKIMEAMIKNSIFNQGSLTTDITEKNPISEILDAIGKAIGNIIGSITSQPVMLLIGFLVFIIIIFVVFKFTMGGGSSSDVQYAQQTYTQQPYTPQQLYQGVQQFTPQATPIQT